MDRRVGRPTCQPKYVLGGDEFVGSCNKPSEEDGGGGGEISDLRYILKVLKVELA